MVTDPHFRAREAFIQLEDPELGAIPAPGIVPRFVGRIQGQPAVGPKTGEHNAAIYAQLGLTAADLERLSSSNVI